MSVYTAYRCELCKGLKSAELIKGVVPKCKIELVNPTSLNVNTHICLTCIEQIKNA